MPLFTYVVSYKGASYVAQGSHSNFKGFAMTWAGNIPPSAVSTLTPALRKELVHKAYEGAFAAVSGVTHVWQKTVPLGDSAVTIFAIQTER